MNFKKNLSGESFSLTRKVFLIMRLIILLLTIGILQVSAATYAQKVTLDARNASLEDVFDQIRQQTGYSIFYNSDLIEKTRPVTVSLKNADLKEALQAALQGQPLSYEVEDKTIVIKETSFIQNLKDKLKELIANIDVRGRVVGEDGQPLPGATIQVKNTSIATSTDLNGFFSLTNVDPNAILVITFIGYEKMEITAKAELGSIKMVTAQSKLDEVQVIAYGQTSERLSTGDVTTVRAEDIEKSPVTNVLSAIEGRVPGLLITQNSGMPGSSFSVQIRGRNSISNSSVPFFVIDGVPYISQSTTTPGYNINPAYGGVSPLSFLNPMDIESISILKDADATAIYGSRAANGAVLITTKKGKSGKMRFNMDASQGIGEAPLAAHWLNTSQYLAVRHEAFKNDLAQPTKSNAPDLLVWDTTRYTNWQKLLIGGKASYTNVAANISGGNNLAQYLFGVTYDNQSTVFPSDNSDQKIAFHFNFNGASEDQKFKFVITANYLVDNSHLPQYDLTQFINTAPDAPPIYNADGTLNWANSTFQNPMSQVLTKYTGNTNNLVSNALLSYNLTRGLAVRSSFGYTNLQSNETTSYPISSLNPAYSPTGTSQFGTNGISSWIVEPQLTYDFAIGKSHFGALIGSTFQGNTTNSELQVGTGYKVDALLQSIAAAPFLKVSSLTNAVYKYNALFGRINYNYDDTFLVDLNWRRDGSSRFGTNNEFHTFGSIGGAWIFSKESLFRGANPFLSFGKLKASYGTTGNDQIGDYRFYDLFQSSSIPYQGINGLTPTGFYNPDLQWELTKKLEGGIELGFLKDRILLQANYYYDRSSNQLVYSTEPSITGFTLLPLNLPAIVQNAGWEFTLSTKNIDSKDLKWRSAFNLTVNRNKLVAFPGLTTNPVFANTYAIGQPVSAIKLYHSLGVDPQTGVYAFQGSNGSATFTPSATTDKTVYLDLAPRFYGGFQNSFTYKGWQLDLFFEFKKQVGPNPIFTSGFPPGGSVQINYVNGILGRWQMPGDHAALQQFTQSFSSKAFTASQYANSSDLAYVDASYIRLANTSLLYQLPDGFTKKLHLDRLKLFIRGQNLFTITGYKGLDPETINNSVLPVLRIITGGLQISM